jgi:pyruvate dehydrogenase E1 component beta subunit
MGDMSYRDAVNLALHEEMERDDKVITFGEDVAQYEGSYKATRGLLKKFGPERVFDTPISEAAIIGAAIGAAMGGLRPVPELMTVNFAYVAMDQLLNHMALMRYMFGGQVTLPITVRMPSGGGHQLGSQHSHSLEAHFVHTPGLIVLCPATPADARALLRAAIRDDNPVIFLEQVGLYSLKGDVPDEAGPAEIGKANVLREGKDVSIIAYGAMTRVALEAAQALEKEGISAEVIDLRSLRPWDKETVVGSVSKTHRVIVVEEPPPMCGIGAEISASIQEMAFDDLDAPVRRVSGADVQLPYAKNLEQACIPHAPDVIKAVKETLGL